MQAQIIRPTRACIVIKTFFAVVAEADDDVWLVVLKNADLVPIIILSTTPILH